MQQFNFPEWEVTSSKEFTATLDSLPQNPFDQPSDTSNYIAVHTNDYLRLSVHPEVQEARKKSMDSYGSGTGASAIFRGDGGAHQNLVKALSETMKCENALLATAGWSANVGVVEAAVHKAETPIYLDLHAHASLWDGAKLTMGRPILIRHNSPDHMEMRMKRFGPGIVCIDAVYSTDGSVCDLPAYIELCEKYDSLLILDEAHSYGLYGENGGGLAVQLGLQDKVPIRTASMSKALGGHGGFIAASNAFIHYLSYRMRSLVFSSNTSPIQSAGAAAAIQVFRRERNRAQTCLENAKYLRSLFAERGIHPGTSDSQIVSIWFDDAWHSAHLHRLLKEQGILISVFLPPATPRGTSMGRFSIHAETTREDMVRIADATSTALQKMGVTVKAPETVAKKSGLV